MRAVEQLTPLLVLDRPGRLSFPTRGPSRYFGGTTVAWISRTHPLSASCPRRIAALSSLALVEKDLKRDATDDEVLGVIVKAVKTRKESVDAYTAANRADLAEGESAEIAILSAYMPEQMSDADVDALVAEAISATGAASAKEMGKVMGWLGPKTKGRVDGKVLSGKVTAALAARG